MIKGLRGRGQWREEKSNTEERTAGMEERTHGAMDEVCGVREWAT